MSCPCRAPRTHASRGLPSDVRRDVCTDAIYPGLLNVLQVVVFLQVDGFTLVQDAVADITKTVQANLEIWQRLAS